MDRSRDVDNPRCPGLIGVQKGGGTEKTVGQCRAERRHHGGRSRFAKQGKFGAARRGGDEFLDAMRTGNDEKASQMLAPLARQKAKDLDRSVTPAASDTARFMIGKVEYLGSDGVRVAATWTDLDEEGKTHADEALWMVRLEDKNWKIVGVAATIFPGEPPLKLNFEDPEEMLKKQQWVREEIRRRAEQDNLQAKEPENSKNFNRR